MAAPLPSYHHPIRFAVANPVLRIHPDSAGAGTAQNVTLAVATDEDYWMSGDGERATAGRRDLLAVLQDALNTNTDGEQYAATLDADGFVEIASLSGNEFDLLWTHANTTVDAPTFGFRQTVDSTGADVHVSPNQARGVWLPERPKRTDTRDEPVTAGALMETIDGGSRGYELASGYERYITHHLVDRTNILTELAAADRPLGSLDFAWVYGGWSRGAPIRFYEDKTNRTPWNWKHYRRKRRARPWREMGVSALKRYTVDLDMRRVAVPPAFSSTLAFDFDGVNEFVDCSFANALDGASRATWAFWLYISSWSTLRYIMSRWSGAGVNRQFLVQTATTGNLRFTLANSAGTAIFVDTTGAPVPLSTWTHVAIAYDGDEPTNTNRVRVAVNGAAATLGAPSGTWPTSINTPGAGVGFRLGALTGSTSNALAGRLAEPAVWSGTAASVGQYAELAPSGEVANYDALATMPRPDHWWRADGAVFPDVYDRGASARRADGVMTAMEVGDLVGGP